VTKRATTAHGVGKLSLRVKERIRRAKRCARLLTLYKRSWGQLRTGSYPVVWVMVLALAVLGVYVLSSPEDRTMIVRALIGLLGQ
jgi:hypothetical protein